MGPVYEDPPPSLTYPSNRLKPFLIRFSILATRKFIWWSSYLYTASLCTWPRLRMAKDMVLNSVVSLVVAYLGSTSKCLLMLLIHVLIRLRVFRIDILKSRLWYFVLQSRRYDFWLMRSLLLLLSYELLTIPPMINNSVHD